MSNINILKVPFFSQYEDVTIEEFRSYACAPTAAYMILKYYNDSLNVSLDEFIQNVNSLGGFNEVGCIHFLLIASIHNLGYLAHTEEFRSEAKGFGASDYVEQFKSEQINNLIFNIENGRPVIISLKHDDGRSGSHCVTLVGVEIENDKPVNWYVNDPESKTREALIIPHEKLSERLRPFQIHIYKSLVS